jgi:two-component SAPR family response regulator
VVLIVDDEPDITTTLQITLEDNGFELDTKIKKIDNKVRVCFLTALTEFQEYESFRKEVFPEEGKRYFIQKPVRNEEVVRMINTITMI